MDFLYNLLDTVFNVTKVGGVLWAVWGAVALALALKDKSGPDLKNAIFQFAGGVAVVLIIETAATYIRSLW